MPGRLGIAEATDGLAVLDDVRDGRDVGVRQLVDLALRQPSEGCVFQLAEAAAERLQDVVVEVLAAQTQHGVLEPRGVQCLEVRIANAAEVHVGDIGAKGHAVKGLNLHRLLLASAQPSAFLRARRQFATRTAGLRARIRSQLRLEASAVFYGAAS